MKKFQIHLNLTIFIFISFILIFGQNLYNFEYRSTLKDTFYRLKTLNRHHLVYSDTTVNKINFIKNIEYTSEYLPRFGDFVNQFEFHPYWSLEKGRFVYENDNIVYRLSNEIEEYLISKNINLPEICSFKSKSDTEIEPTFKSIDHDKSVNSINVKYQLVDIIQKYQITSGYLFIRIFDNEENLVADILINNNDNLNFFQGNYKPMVKNYLSDKIVIDAYKTPDNLLKYVIFTKQVKDFSYKINSIDNNLYKDIFSTDRDLDKFIDDLIIITQGSKSEDNLIKETYTYTTKCSPSNI